MLRREGRGIEARDLFEEALALDPNHRWTLTFFSKLLRDLGETEYADELSRRLSAVEMGEVRTKPGEHDLDDYDD